MKKLIILFYFACNLVYGQVALDANRDNIWGIGHHQANLSFRSLFDFSSDPFTQFSSYTPIYTFLTNSSICDGSGRLLFYTNGMYVCDSTNQIMPHGDSLSFGDLYLHLEHATYGYIMIQGALSLPFPGSTSIYYIFHEKANWYDPPASVIVPGLQYSIVDMNLNEGKGDIIIKNQVAIRDTVNYGMLTAVRHANGRDWWILVPGFFVPVYHRILLSPQGLSTWEQEVPGPPTLIPEVGQAVFTPDGNKYIRCGTSSLILPFGLEVFSFDRCTGLLSDYLDLTGVCDLTNDIPSLAVSPSSRYLYVSNCYTIYQFDLQSPDIESSKQVVATYDNFLWLNTKTIFGVMQLGPDGKIYVGASSTPYLHVINYPDNAGIACDIQQHAIYLNYTNDCGLPNFPNFRLGPLAGSPCDSLFYQIPEQTALYNHLIEVYPNPASAQINFRLSESVSYTGLKMEIFNALGQKSDLIPISPYQLIVNYNTNMLANGIYQAILRKGDRVLGKVKFIVQRN